MNEQTPHGKSEVVGRAVCVDGHDIDTDRIIPARFLKCVTFDALGPQLFFDERFDAEGASLDHPIDAPEHAGATIMVCGKNFGCGSSREHAPQAIWRWGFRALVGGSFAEIFFANSLAIGLPCVCLTDADLAALTALVTADPAAEVNVGVDGTVRCGTATFQGRIPDAARDAFLEGRWDPLDELREGMEATATVAAGLPYVDWTTAG